ncbi:triosephosphate isomerase [Gemmobacter megaterium]|uniref:Triosephosphate isomerase n=1 Tax=Gemmobacter megaterium TaxID=1086013 RepID=A0A1N7QMZ7_9RHOB|nr:triose-phosphate isomerase [Gemmobacter megaterium]GGE27777.1 triosephosphate isomerase [Gemmobacter megaterium]SIT24211.1 triosephosphate isomerase [Gemmobacter megaterium]
MTRKLAAGNWKMHGLKADLAELAAICAAPQPGCDVLLCLPATLVHRGVCAAEGRIAIGGQDCHAAPQGAHTGDISAAMLVDAGASHVILGHSERRADHAETDAMVAEKARAAQAAGLMAIVCLGETLAEREAGHTLAVVGRQLAASVPEGADPARLVVAYEPVWAIGSGRTPTEAQIAEVHSALREGLARRFGTGAAEQVPLLYGGSVKPANAAAIFALPHVDGALVGGASLKAADFLAIVAALGAA